MNELPGFQVVMECFRHQHWRFLADESRRSLRSDFHGKLAFYRCLVRVDGPDDLVQFVTFLPFVVPTHRRTAVAELCVRLSHGLRNGRFDMDFQNGQLRFFTALTYPKGHLEQDVVARTLRLALVIADQHLPNFVNILFGNPAPQTALDQFQPRRRPRIDLN